LVSFSLSNGRRDGHGSWNCQAGTSESSALAHPRLSDSGSLHLYLCQDFEPLVRASPSDWRVANLRSVYLVSPVPCPMLSFPPTFFRNSPSNRPVPPGNPRRHSARLRTTQIQGLAEHTARKDGTSPYHTIAYPTTTVIFINIYPPPPQTTRSASSPNTHTTKPSNAPANSPSYGLSTPTQPSASSPSSSSSSNASSASPHQQEPRRRRRPQSHPYATHSTPSTTTSRAPSSSHRPSSFCWSRGRTLLVRWAGSRGLGIDS
jgi:hypothetical protein